MTVVAGTPAPVGQDAAPEGGPADGAPVGGTRGRRLVWAGAVAGVVVLGALIVALTVPPTTRGDLEPTSAAPPGARAVVEILRREGVDVRTEQRSDDVAAAADAGSTVVVVLPERLGPTQLDRLAATRARLVLVEPDLPVVRALAPFAAVAGTQEARIAGPGCDDPDATAAGTARAGGSLYRLTAGAGTLCYPADAAPGGDARGSLLIGSAAGREVVVLGQADVLRNEHLAAAGNAALALRLLGQTERLVWYLPDPFESGPDAGDELGDLVPPWVPWVTAQLVVAVLAVLLWRGRRFGRLVTEPLPVVVRASETQEGRARLYRAARAHGRAGATLRTAALRRVARRVDVGPDATPDLVVALVAEATGLPQTRVHRAFLGPAPTDDRGLVALADELAAVEAALAAGRPAATGPPSSAAPAAPDAPTSPDARKGPDR